jgi:hypothetical protein
MKQNVEEIIGTKINRLTAIEFVEKDKGSHLIYKWQCDCGQVKMFLHHCYYSFDALSFLSFSSYSIINWFKVVGF